MDVAELESSVKVALGARLDLTPEDEAHDRVESKRFGEEVQRWIRALGTAAAPNGLFATAS